MIRGTGSVLGSSQSLKVHAHKIIVVPIWGIQSMAVVFILGDLQAAHWEKVERECEDVSYALLHNSSTLC